MKIAVLIKQVPATDKVKMDEQTGTMIREGVESELNPLDMYAIEEAVRIRKKLDKKIKITAISMGPPGAKDIIKDAISMGCDTGYLLSDRKFAGADTWATAYTLKKAIEKLGGFDIIFTGERATDGETGQVGPSIGSQLNIPVLTYVSKIEYLDEEKIVVERSIEGGYEIIRANLPVLVSVIKEINEPEIPNLESKIRAKKSNIPLFSAEDIKASSESIGLTGSPTRVVKVLYPKMSRDGRIINSKDPELAVDELISFLQGKGMI